jgi:hypothetical protein
MVSVVGAIWLVKKGFSTDRYTEAQPPASSGIFHALESLYDQNHKKKPA